MIKEKIDIHWTSSTLKSCLDIIKKVERQCPEREKIFANHLIHKGLVSRTYKELLQLNNKKPNNLILKWAKDPNKNFSKEDIHIALSMWNSTLVITETQIKITMTYHFTNQQKGWKKQGNNKSMGEDMKKLNLQTLLVDM